MQGKVWAWDDEPEPTQWESTVLSGVSIGEVGITATGGTARVELFAIF